MTTGSALPLPDHPADPAAGLLAGARELCHPVRLSEQHRDPDGVRCRRAGEEDRLHRRGAGVGKHVRL